MVLNLSRITNNVTSIFACLWHCPFLAAKDSLECFFLSVSQRSFAFRAFSLTESVILQTCALSFQWLIWVISRLDLTNKKTLALTMIKWLLTLLTILDNLRNSPHDIYESDLRTESDTGRQSLLFAVFFVWETLFLRVRWNLNGERWLGNPLFEMCCFHMGIARKGGGVKRLARIVWVWGTFFPRCLGV